MASITINGRSFSGNSVSIVNGSVFINGSKVDAGDSKEIKIEVVGNVDQLKVDSCDSLTISGSAGSVSTVSGDVKCGDVSGSVSSVSGDVACGSVGGAVSTVSGDILKK